MGMDILESYPARRKPPQSELAFRLRARAASVAMGTIKAIVCRVGAEPVLEELEAKLDAFQRIVGGSIEVFPVRPFGDPCLAGYCRDNGRFEVPPNRVFGTVGLVYGDLVVFNADREDEGSCTPADLAWLKTNSRKVRS